MESDLLFRRTWPTVYPKKYAHGFVVLCFAVVTQSFIMNSHEVFIHIHQGCFAGTGAIVRLLQCQWSKPDGYGKISQCITTTKHSKAKTVCIFLGIYCTLIWHAFSAAWWRLQMEIFPRYWPLWGESTGHRWIPLKGQWHGALMACLICPWTNGGNNRDTFGLRRRCAYYNVTVIQDRVQSLYIA